MNFYDEVCSAYAEIISMGLPIAFLLFVNMFFNYLAVIFHQDPPFRTSPSSRGAVIEYGDSNKRRGISVSEPFAL